MTPSLVCTVKLLYYSKATELLGLLDLANNGTGKLNQIFQVHKA